MWKTYLFKWLFPAYFVFLGILFGSFLTGHEFFALVCYGISGVIVCYYLIGFLKKRYPLPAKRIKIVFTVLLCIGLGIFAITESLILYASFGSDKKDHQYIVVLGARVYGTRPSISLADRIAAAYYYMTDNPEVIAVLSGGQGPDEDISEAKCMYQALTALGIEPERLRLEEKSTSTWENLTYSLDLIEKETGSRPQTIGLVSSEYHLFRAGMFARDCGVTANGIPATTSLFTIRVNHLMREVAGVWHYLILGGQYQ